jgi:LPXTG-site transpeptidase (sortase) family protein
MTTKEKVQFLIFRSIGNFLLLISIYGVFVTFSPVLSQEIRVRVEKARGITYVVKSQAEIAKVDEPKVILNTPGALTALLDNQKEHILIPKDTLFSILIPKIGASARIIPNVDPSSETEFRSALQQGVAHAKGTVFPGIPGNTYLFAHSTDNWWNVGRYNAVFYLLKDLEKGDDVIVYFEYRRYNYKVTDKYIADPSEVALLVNNRGLTQKLILQTCWPPGTTWKRLFVVARPSPQSQ